LDTTLNLKAFIAAPSEGITSIIIFVMASFWGLYWIPLRYLEAEGISGGWAIALLNFPAVVLLLPVVIWQWRQHQKQFWYCVLIGVLTGLGMALYTSGLIYSSVVRATLLFYLTPAWATLIGIFWLGEKATWQRWAAIGIGLAGLGLLVSGGSEVPLNIGDLFALLAGLFWAIGAAVIKRYDTVPLAGMTMFQFLFTSISAVLLGFMMGDFQVPSFDVVLPAIPLSALISLGIILPSVWLIFWAQKVLFPVRVGLLMMSEVLLAVVSASILLPEEAMSLMAWCGAALIIAACFIEVFSSPEPSSS
jgi:drug/metabolite transporter (DMT)-like permease